MTVRIVLAQFASTADVETNVAEIETIVREAANIGGDLVAFHELATTNYFCLDRRKSSHLDLAEPIPGPTTERMAALSTRYNIHAILPLYEDAGGKRYNSAVLIEPRRGVVGLYRKSHVATHRTVGAEIGAEESYYFSPGDTGFKVWWSSLGLRIGTLICYDRHHPEGQIAYGLQRADIVFVPTASYRSGIVTGDLWEAELRAMAFQNSYYVAGINKVGPVVGLDQSQCYPGRSVVVSPEGEIVAMGGDGEQLIVAEVDPNRAKVARETLQLFEHKRPELYGSIVGRHVGEG